jgi:hypothetical protein
MAAESRIESVVTDLTKSGELVEQIGRFRELYQTLMGRPRKAESDRQILSEAVRFACEAWHAIYTALTFRLAGKGGYVEFDDEDVCSSFLRRYAKKYLLNTAIPVLKYHIAFVFAKQQGQVV